ncbi:hypothetical protein Hanom_Chr05g00398551 [Helianthus anomalus]
MPLDDWAAIRRKTPHGKCIILFNQYTWSNCSVQSILGMVLFYNIFTNLRSRVSLPRKV